MKPPAPQPDLRAASDGGMFVAHYAVMDPARSMDTPAPVPSVMFEEHTVPTPETLAEAALSEDQRAFKAQILATSTNIDSAPRSDVPGFGTTRTTFGRRHRGSVAWVLLGALLALLLAAAALVRPKPLEPTTAAASAPVVRAPAPRAEEPAPPVAARTAQAPVPRDVAPPSLPSARLPTSRASAPRARSVVTLGGAGPAASSPSPTEPTSDFPLGPQ